MPIAALVLEGLEDVGRRNIDGQLGFFDGEETVSSSVFSLPNVQELPYEELLAMEKEVSGLYLTGHPLKPYEAWHDRLKVDRIDAILESFSELAETETEYTDGQTVRLFGLLGVPQIKNTRAGAQMAYAVLEDMYGSIELVFFSRVLESCRSLLQAGEAVVVRGKISAREDEAPKVLVSSVEKAPSPDSLPKEEPPKAAANPGVYIKIPSLDSGEWKRVQRVLRVLEGETPVYVRVADTGKLMRAPRDLWVTPHDALIKELAYILGAENVAKMC